MVARQGIDYCFANLAYQILEDLGDGKNLIQLGIRSSGQPKEYWENLYGVQQYCANEISTPSIPSIADQIIEHLTKEQIDEVYVSFDIDAIDEKYASATGTPEPNGLSPEMPMMLLAPILKNLNVQEQIWLRWRHGLLAPQLKRRCRNRKHTHGRRVHFKLPIGAFK